MTGVRYILVPVGVAFWFVLIAIMRVLNWTRLIELQYDHSARMRLFLWPRFVLYEWEPEEFEGWGHPFAALFTSTLDWVCSEPDTEPGPDVAAEGAQP